MTENQMTEAQEFINALTSRWEYEQCLEVVAYVMGYFEGRLGEKQLHDDEDAE